MSNQVLGYQDSNIQKRFRGPAWIMAMMMGVIYCVGASLMFMVLTALVPASREYGSIVLVWLSVLAIMGLISLATGITYIWCSVRVHRGSSRAANAALVVAIIHCVALGVLLISGIALIVISTPTNVFDLTEPIAFCAMLALPIISNAVRAWLLVKTRREMRSCI